MAASKKIGLESKLGLKENYAGQKIKLGGKRRRSGNINIVKSLKRKRLRMKLVDGKNKREQQGG